MAPTLRSTLLLLAWCMPNHAAATQLHRTEIHWEAVKGCPSESDVLRQIEERLGQSLEAPREQSLRLHAKVTKSKAGEFEVLLSSEGASGLGQRRLSNPDCAKLAEAAAFVMAIAIDPKLIERQHPVLEQGEPPRGQVPTADVATPAPTAPASAMPTNEAPTAAASTSSNALQVPNQLPRVSSSVRLSGRMALSRAQTPQHAFDRWSTAADALIGTGTLPGTYLGARANVGFFASPLIELRLGAGGLLPRTVAVFDGGGSMSLKAGFLDVGACAVPIRGSFRWQLCAATEIGLIDAQGSNLTNSHGANAGYASAVLEMGVGYKFGSGLGIAGSTGLGLGMVRPRFGVDLNGEPNEIFRAELFSPRLNLGVFWDLP